MITLAWMRWAELYCPSACGGRRNSQIQIPIPKLRDSKKLTAKQREEIYQQLVNSEISFVVEFISVEEINQFGIGWANREIFRRLKSKLNAEVYIADGNLKIEGVKSIIKADSKFQKLWPPR